jgi:hypothetical protein
MEFGSKVNVDSGVKRISADSAFGHSMTQYLIAGLQQTEQFAILNLLGQSKTDRSRLDFHRGNEADSTRKD